MKKEAQSTVQQDVKGERKLTSIWEKIIFVNKERFEYGTRIKEAYKKLSNSLSCS